MPRKQRNTEELPVHLIDSVCERFVVGTVIRGGWDDFRAVNGTLSDDDLATYEARKVWNLVCEVAEKSEEPSIAAVMRLATSRKVELTYGTLLDLTEQGVPGVSLQRWVERLRKLAVDREAYRLGELIRLYTEQGYTDNAAEITAARERLAKLDHVALKDESKPGTFASVIEECGGLDKIFARPIGVIEPPFAGLRSKMNGGFAPGTVTVVGARPSAGKSAFAVQTALAAAGANHRTRVFSLEMAKTELVKRIMSAHGSVDYSRLIRGELDKEDRARIRNVEVELKDWPLEIYCDLFDMRSIVAKINSDKPKCEFAVIDYLGLIESGQRAENRNQELSSVSRRLKMLAMETGIPLLVLHQLNRGSETDDRRPILRDLRDSGSIEQDADNVLFVHQPGGRKQEGPRDQREFIIAKQRNGEKDRTIPMRFVGHHVRFEEPQDAREWNT